MSYYRFLEKSNFIPLFEIFISIVCLCVHAGTCMPQPACKSQKDNFWELVLSGDQQVV